MSGRPPPPRGPPPRGPPPPSGANSRPPPPRGPPPGGARPPPPRGPPPRGPASNVPVPGPGGVEKPPPPRGPPPPPAPPAGGKKRRAPPPPPPPPPPVSTEPTPGESGEGAVAPGAEDSAAAGAAQAAPPPPPPDDAPPEDEDEARQKEAEEAARNKPPPGRLTVTCIAGRGLKKPGTRQPKTLSINPYMRFGLGGRDSAMRQRSSTVKRANKNPDFKSAQVSFDLTEPEALLAAQQKDIAAALAKRGGAPAPTDGAGLVLHISLLSDSSLSDTLLGECDIDLTPLFVGGRVSGWFDVSLPESVAAGRAKAAPADTVGAAAESAEERVHMGQVKLDVNFLVARTGVVALRIVEGRNLLNMEMVGKQDPYVKLQLGDAVKRGKTVHKGGRNPYFGEEEVAFWLDRGNWTEDLTFSCFDEDVGQDDLIGATKFSLLPLQHNGEKGAKTEEWVTLNNGKRVAGEVKIRTEFFPAGTLMLRCVEGRDLLDTDTFGKQDPYVKLRLQGKLHSHEARTRTDKDGGTAPKWDQSFSFELVDQYVLEMEVYDEDTMDKDDLIGKANIPLLPVFKRGFVEAWVTIKRSSKWGTAEKTGEIKLEFDFYGPPGVAYPQRQEMAESFDDSKRVNKSAREQERRERERQAKEARFKAAAEGSGAAGDEFTDEEILQAFTFVDLDKNQFVGAAEIRHILVCMGELITDEEVDEMIRLIDQDGDGQVSFEEFYRLARHPDPSAHDFNPNAPPAATAAKQKERGEVPPPPPPKDGVDKRALEKQRREQQLRAQKRKMLKACVDDNSFSLQHLFVAYKKFQREDVGRTGEADFDLMCLVLGLEPTGEYRRLFGLFDPTDTGHVDMRELLLGFVPFTGADQQKRIEFAFTIFDEDNNQYITEAELMHILKANHLAAELQSVQRKARTIMRQVDKNGDGRLSMEEFHVIGRKFPNLLWPPA